MAGTHTSELVRLRGEQYINLTTFRKNGQAVRTPVWFAEDGGKLYVLTGRNAGKIKRIRNNGRVEVGPSDRAGKPTGPTQTATARVLPLSDGPRVEQMITRKYGWQKRGFDLIERAIGLVRRRSSQLGRDYVEIELGA